MERIINYRDIEWDYEKNKFQPIEVSRNSAKRAWWKCRHGHSWSMKINERKAKAFMLMSQTAQCLRHTLNLQRRC